jgi:hypothetical protein
LARRVVEEGYLPKHRPTALLIEEMMQAQRREWRMRVGLVFGSLAAVLLILALAVLAHLAD